MRRTIIGPMQTLIYAVVLLAGSASWIGVSTSARADEVTPERGDHVSENDTPEVTEWDTASPHTITTISHNNKDYLQIKTVEFTPPANWSFIRLDGGSFMDFTVGVADAALPADNRPSEKKHVDTASKVQIHTTILEPASAGQFPIWVEGNLQPPKGEGGDTWRWGAKVQDMPSVRIAFTFDDGPHVTTNGRTEQIIDTLKSKEASLEKEIRVTFFTEHSRITSGLGKNILKNLMTANEHEVAIHGADPDVHHRNHEDTPDLKSKLSTQTSIVASAAAGGQTAQNVRPPGAWVSMDDPGAVYTKAQVKAIWDDVELNRYTGPGTNGPTSDSWTPGLVYSQANHDDFLQVIKDAIDNAADDDDGVYEVETLVALMHDLRAADTAAVGPIIDEIEQYAETKDVLIQYVRVKDL